jgi:hypothetical protein
MQYNFNTRVSEQGTIALPYMPELFNKMVQVTLIDLQTPQAQAIEEQPARKGKLTDGFNIWGDEPEETITEYRTRIWRTERNAW